MQFILIITVFGSIFCRESYSLQHQQVRHVGLQPIDFAHPLDIRLSQQLLRSPLLLSIIRAAASPLEQAYVAENLASSVQVGPKQMSTLHQSLLQAARILDMEPPDLYIRQNSVPNAYTLAIQGRRPFIVMHSSILDLLEENELQAVLAHELGHLKCEHGVLVTLLNLLILASEALSSSFLAMVSFS